MDFLKGAAQRIIQTDRAFVPRPLKRLVARASPIDYFLNEPIGQVFLADDVYETYLCYNNFYSALNPENAVPCRLHVDLHDATGAVVARADADLATHGSTALAASEVLREAGAACPVGLAASTIRPATDDPEAIERFKQMGRISSHFFTYYLNRRTEAMAIIHPQSAINQAGGEGTTNWRSAQSIVTRGLEGVSLYQANHSRRPAEVTYTLADRATDDPLARRTNRVAPVSAAAVHFELADLPRVPDVLTLRVERLPTPNGKPLLMRRYPGGRFSMSHS